MFVAALLALAMWVNLTVAEATSWFRTEAAPDCSRQAGSLPNSSKAAGVADPTIPIEHIVISMQENHSFDEYFGRLNGAAYYGNDVDGVTSKLFNKNKQGKRVYAYHETNRCVSDPGHTWEAMHESWNKGRNDGFVRVNGIKAMGYYEATELPFYYALANQFATSDRYFGSALTQTYPNRFFLYAGTAFGHIRNDNPPNFTTEYSQKTIFDLLNQHKISWRYYTDGMPYLWMFGPMYHANRDKIRKLSDYESDLKNGTLPQVAMVESIAEKEDEHPSADVARGEAWERARITALINSPYWKNSVYFLMYDESGGFFDHVPPPAACLPETVKPGDPLFDHYGFRVPFLAISPYAKHHYVSHEVYDHTSVLKFIERKFNLPALTVRDANAQGLEDLFDFNSAPKLDVAPLPESKYDPSTSCAREGLES